jgi:hypothetical protein
MVKESPKAAGVTIGGIVESLLGRLTSPFLVPAPCSSLDPDLFGVCRTEQDRIA